MSRLSDFPAQLRASTVQPDVVYARADGYYAVHGKSRTASARASKAVLTLNDGEIAIYKGAPKVVTANNANITAVYTPGNNALTVPTGQVFVRFAGDVDAATQRDSLEKMGFTITQTLSYAPNAAWLRHIDNDAAAALNAIPLLEKLDRVENVEPQLISPRALRY
jgi:hypothetical protein